VIVRLTRSAEADVEGVLSWYRERGHELADQFFGALERCLESVERNPLAFGKVHGDIRRALLRRFPYCVFYIVSQQEIVVLACVHGHRDPETWKSRRDA
jgi:plasmid stabilization system protein ParE